MAEGVLDTLKIVLELDPDKFKKGLEEVQRHFKGLREDSVRTGDELESRGGQASQFFDRITTSALKLGATMLGGLGLEKFIASTTAAGNSAFYAAKNIGISVEELNKVKGVVRTMGGDVSQVEDSLLKLSQALTRIQLDPKNAAQFIAAFQAIGIEKFTDVNGRFLTLAELLPKIRAGLSAQSDQVRVFFGQQIGLQDALINAFGLSDKEYQKVEENVNKVGVASTGAAKAAQELTKSWGTFETFISRVSGEFTEELDPVLTGTIDLVTKLGVKFDEIGKDYSKSDLFTAIGGIIGMMFGGLPGAIIGTGLGGILGYLGSDKSPKWLTAFGEAQEALAPPRGPAPSTAPTTTGAGGPAPMDYQSMVQRLRRWMATPTVSTTPTTPPAAAPDNLSGIIQTLEGGKVSSRTPTGNPKDPYAYGRNQITLGTALTIDKTATPAKLLNADYNDAIFIQLQEKYKKKYGDNLDARAIAYHNGPDAADRFVASGGSTASIPNWGPQSQAYLDKERAMSSVSSSTNTSTSTANIGTINVNAPNATDGKQVAAEMSAYLKKYNMLDTANGGPQ